MKTLLNPIAIGIFTAVILMRIAHADVDVGKGSISTNEVINEFSPTASSPQEEEDTVDVGKKREICRGIKINCGTSSEPPRRPKVDWGNKPPVGTTRPSYCQEKAISVEVLFDYNSEQLTAAAIEQLRPFGEALSSEQLKGLSYRVEGHTDAIGGESYNKDLSLRRAESVKNYLQYQFQFSGKGMQAVGKGKSQLADPANPTSEKNRRVRIIKLACNK